MGMQKGTGPREGPRLPAWNVSSPAVGRGHLEAAAESQWFLGAESQLRPLLRVWEGHPGLSPWEAGDTLGQWPVDTTATLAVFPEV